MKTLEEMNPRELANLTVFLNSIEQQIEISKRTDEELLEMTMDYWGDLEIDNPLAALLFELMERLEDKQDETSWAGCWYTWFCGVGSQESAGSWRC